MKQVSARKNSLFGYYLSFNKHGAIRSLKRSVKHSFALWRLSRKRRASEATFIGVTGSSGKSTTTALLSEILGSHANTRSQVLTNQLRALSSTIQEIKNTDKFVVAELGVARPGDMLPQAKLLSPHVAIVTRVGNEHYSSFRGKEGVAKEKSGLVCQVRPEGFAVLNADDPHVLGMASLTKAKIVTFGFSESADYRVVGFQYEFPKPLVIQLIARGEAHTLQTRLLGAQFAGSVAAAYATACELGVPHDRIAQAISNFHGVFARCSFMASEKGPQFIVDTAKAPFDTLESAFDVIKGSCSPRKRIVLGAISDYAGNPWPKYTAAYEAAASLADEVIFVGEASHRARVSEKDLALGKFKAFKTFREAFSYVRETAITDELILLKGSANLHLERIALSFSSAVNCMIENCGKGIDCVTCGQYSVPFDRHLKKKRQFSSGLKIPNL